MFIFIDESGTFTHGAGATAICLVGALVLPEGNAPKIQSKYQGIRASLPKENGEVKGRLLTESQVDRVVMMLSKNDALFEVVGIDMSAHTAQGVQAHKSGQEQGMTANITADFHPNVQQGAWDLRRRLEAMPRQLYVQSVATFELIAITIEHATIYFSQRQPKALEYFHWVIDAKDRGRVTDWESWWSFTVMPMTQSRYLRRPIGQFVEGDYSFFARFDTEIPEHLRPHLSNPQERTGLDARKLLTESFRFSDQSEPGLEMVDILTNATRRALTGRLAIEGWRNIPRLMIHRRQHYVNLISLEHVAASHPFPYGNVLRHFSRGGKSMLAPRFNSRP